MMFVLDPKDTRVILIGASTFEDKDLPPLPAIKDNNVKLRALLGDVAGISKDDVHILEDRDYANQITAEISKIASKSLDIIYYAGHGLPHAKQLYLATKKTASDDPESSGALLADHLVQIIINKSKAKRIIFIFDCCFSGFARENIDTKGKEVFLLTATSSVETAKSEAPENNNYTAFTHELLAILEQGIDSAGEILTLQDIFSGLKERLENQDLPLPRITSYGSPNELGICQNRTYQNILSNQKPRVYIERPPIEANCYTEILKPGALIRIKAPAKMGKTQLMNKILEHAKEKGYLTMILDIRLAGTKNLADLDKFLRWLSTVVSDELNLSNELETYWKTDSSNYNITRYFQKYLLPLLENTLVLALDNVDLVFENTQTAQDFCGLLRSWNQKAAGGDNTFKKLNFIVVHSTEVYTVIDINHSPLANLGLTVEPQELTLEQVHHLAEQYQVSWNDSDINQLMELVKGHPYLVTEALEKSVQQQCPFQDLFQSAHTEAGIYGNHLRQLSIELEQNSNLLEALKKVISTTKPVRLETTPKFQLHRMGLLHLQGNEVIVSRQLYRKYFCDCLGINQ